MKLARNKQICELYQKGWTGTEIAKHFNLKPNIVFALLKKWYPRVYDRPYIGHNTTEYKEAYYKKLYEKYKQVYKPFLYTHGELAELMDCSVPHLIKLIDMYNLNHIRLQTFKHYKSLCNVPDVFLEEIKTFCDKNGFASVRQLAVRAINEYILQHSTLEEEYDRKD